MAGAIPDALPAGVAVTIPVTGVGYASELTFSIDGTDCTAAREDAEVGLDHTFVGDLVGTLIGPDGQTVTLFDRDGGSGDDLCQTVFDDEATQSFASVPANRAPFTGSWRPAIGLLDELLLQPVDGDWTFKVVDRASRDTGSIRAVALHITGFAE